MIMISSSLEVDFLEAGISDRLLLNMDFVAIVKNRYISKFIKKYF